jgi:hypothetical protein
MVMKSGNSKARLFRLTMRGTKNGELSSRDCFSVQESINAIDLFSICANLQFPPGLLIFDPPLLGIGTEVEEEGSSVARPFAVENSAVLEWRPEREKEMWERKRAREQERREERERERERKRKRTRKRKRKKEKRERKKGRRKRRRREKRSRRAKKREQ